MAQLPQRSQTPLRQEVAEQTIAVLVLLGLLLYTYGLFLVAPYSGALYGSSGRVVAVYVPTGLQDGDQLIQVGPIRWDDYQADMMLTLFDQNRPGDVIPTRVKRAGQLVEVGWIFSGFSWREFWVGRFVSQWFLAYFFWGAGLMALLVLRPRDVRRRLFVAFNFLTALWLMASMLSAKHFWGSAFVLHAAFWLTVPVYWHLHWVFPQPLSKVPAFIWWVLYGLALVLVAAEGLQVLPPNAYLIGFLLALTGSLVFLVAHLFIGPTQRRDIALLVLGAGLALVPSIGLGLVGLLIPTAAGLAAGGVLTLPIVPAAYLYIVLRRRLGGLEIRLNRYISLYIFLLLLSAIIVVPAAFFDSILNFKGDTPLIILGAVIISVGITLRGFPAVQRFVEFRLLGVPVPPRRLLETYTVQIINALDRDSLLGMLKDNLLPSLLIRQSALLRLEDFSHPTVLYRSEVEVQQLPTAQELPQLSKQAGHQRLPPLMGEAPALCPWARVVLPLSLSDRPLALWLLGRRDPDDYYSPEEIRLLQTIAAQAAIALAHIEQTEQVRALHQVNIDRHETERANLAHELHDDVLNELGVLSVELEDASPRFYQHLQRINDRLRQTITGLRPAALDYGLRAALDSLVDELILQSKNALQIQVDLPATDVRYPVVVEQHVYRIIQQAGNNVVRHARAHTLRLYGLLEPGQIDLTVEDDGVGIGGGERLDLASLLASKHFGLPGMYERAAIIEAKIAIDSEPGQRTRVHLVWQSHEQDLEQKI